MSMSGSTKACDDDVDIGDGNSVVITSSKSSSLRLFVVVDGLTEAPPSTKTGLMVGGPAEEEDPLNEGLDEDSLSLLFFFFSVSAVVVVEGTEDVDGKDVGMVVGVPPFDRDFFRCSFVLSRARALIAFVSGRPTSFAFTPPPGFSPSESLLSLLKSVTGPFFPLTLIADDERFSVFG